MRLIGMLDSPYVRRVAVSLKLMDVPFVLEQLSVFRNFEQVRTINPVVKVPTLVTDQGTMLMDSSLILDHVERLAGPERSLMPASGPARDQALHILGLALAANEKAVQLYYERTLRPADKQHQPWIDRVSGQLVDAFAALEKEAKADAAWFAGERIMQPDITVAVAWRFVRHAVPDVVAAEAFPRLAAHAARAEALPAFVETGF